MTDQTKTTVPKLTVAQRELLEELCIKPTVVAGRYAPGRKLVLLGLATETFQNYGYQRLTITEAGREHPCAKST